MAHAIHPLRGTLRGHVQLPPPAPLPRLLPLPSFPGDAPVDDADPTRPWVEGLDEPPTVPNTPHTSWVVASLPREDVAARNAPTVRPPPPPPASRLRLALHGFAAGVTCGAIGLLVMRTLEPSQDAPQAVRTGGSVAAVVAAPAPAAPPSRSRMPEMRAEDLPRVTVTVPVEALPTSSPTSSHRTGRHRFAR